MFKNTTSTLLILLTGALVASVYAQVSQDPDDLLKQEWPCIHDKMEKVPLTFEDVEEANLNEARQGRVLTGTTLNNIRIYPYYGYVTSQGTAYLEYIQNDIVPPIAAYFEAALKLNYPISGAFKIQSTSVCGVATPEIFRSGEISTDFGYILDAAYDSTENWVAASQACSLATGSNRPLVGYTTFNAALLRVPGTNILLHEKNMICIMHEMTHTLGFTHQMFDYFLDTNGNRQTNVIVSGVLDGASCQIITAEPLATMLRSYFGCSTLKGAYMENSGSDATAGSHFERRQFTYEAMTSGLIYQMQYSQFSLGMLESTGWYTVNYSYADPFFFGQGAGCNFLLSTCVNGGASLGEDFCTSGKGCTIPGRGGGECGADTRSDNCRFMQPEVDYDCENADGAAYASLSTLQTFGRGKGAKCFEGTLAQSRAGSSNTFCFKYSCSGSGSSTILNVEVGSETVACTSAGSKTVSGLAGALNCPEPLAFCSTVGQKVCPRGCMGRGECVSGVCNCYSGFDGEDCGLSLASPLL